MKLVVDYWLETAALEATAYMIVLSQNPRSLTHDRSASFLLPPVLDLGEGVVQKGSLL